MNVWFSLAMTILWSTVNWCSVPRYNDVHIVRFVRNEHIMWNKKEILSKHIHNKRNNQNAREKARRQNDWPIINNNRTQLKQRIFRFDFSRAILNDFGGGIFRRWNCCIRSTDMSDVNETIRRKCVHPKWKSIGHSVTYSIRIVHCAVHPVKGNWKTITINLNRQMEEARIVKSVWTNVWEAAAFNTEKA